MKRTRIVWIASMTVIGFLAGQALAEEHGEESMREHTMHHGKKDTGGKQGMMKDMPMMQKTRGHMMGGMMKREVVATDDGGVILVVGNLLLKYDEDLELVKKTTIEISDEDMRRMMEKMQKHCAMCRKMGEGMMEDEQTADEDE